MRYTQIRYYIVLYYTINKSIDFAHTQDIGLSQPIFRFSQPNVTNVAHGHQLKALTGTWISLN